MAMSPDDLRNKTFSIVKKGYERGEVHRFLGSVADELQEYNRANFSDSEIVVADVIDEQEPETASFAGTSDDDQPDLFAETIEEDAELGDVSTPTSTAPSSSSSADDFDRVGNEISLMLRQAQESSIKIRSDAEIEARTLVDQVRLDIETDRLAHEQAAAELIARTEERASAMRTEAEEYAEQVRTTADEYAASRRSEADQVRDEAESAAEADRTAAAATLANAEDDAAASIAEATRRAEEVVANAEADASARSEELLAEAQATLASLTDTERDSRQNLERARESIDAALGKFESSDS